MPPIDDPARPLVVVLDERGHVREANRHACQVLGRQHAELLGADWFALAVPAGEQGDARHAFERLVAVPGEHEEHFEAHVLTRTGEERLIAWSSTLLRSSGGAVEGVVRSGVDVTGHRAGHDPLTGLPDRALLEDHLALAVARARRSEAAIALLAFDLEGFKEVNDTLGRAAGDEVLREAARRVAGVTRAHDLLARTGDDEFVLLLADLDDAAGDSAAVVGRVVSDSLAPAYAVAGTELHLSASIGISIFPDHADNAHDLLERAAAAMSEAGRRGREATPFAPPRVDVRPQRSLATRLRTALGQDELALRFQPVVDPVDGRVQAAEALLRWEDPEHGLTLPGAFLPGAAEAGLLDAVGDWVVDALCRQAHDWSSAGAPPVRLSFNLSAAELDRPGLAGAIIERVAAYGLDPARLCVEVPEAAAGAPAVRDLHEAGFPLALDDFGTGGIPLTRLRALPFDLVKVDRSLLAGVPGDPHADDVVSALLALARALGVAAVAKGVESAAQQAFLVREGCTLVQGFHTGRPMPAAELELLLRAEARFERP